MTSTINASTTAGIVTTADTSGVLALQTAGTTALSISAAQVVTLTNALPVASGGSGVTTSTGTGANVLGTTPSFTSTIGVGAATASASGAGITFPATQSASSDVNTLDDYEEGTWTPSLGGTATYSQQAGTYKKVGGLVYVSAIIQVATLGTGSSSQISGFPFSYTAGPRNTFSVAYWASTVGNISYLAFYLSSGTTGNTIATTAAASTVQDGYGVFQNGTYVIFSGCYHAA